MNLVEHFDHTWRLIHCSLPPTASAGKGGYFEQTSSRRLNSQKMPCQDQKSSAGGEEFVSNLTQASSELKTSWVAK